METAKVIILILMLVFGLIVVVKVFSAPLRLAMKLALNTFFGYIALIIFSFFSFTPGVNLLNAIIVGLFGIPGFILLTLIKWLFGS